MTLAIGLNAEPLVAFSLAAAEQLIEPTDYIAALLPPEDATVAEAGE